MKIIELFSQEGLSYFRQRSIDWDTEKPLGLYSFPYPVQSLYFRKFNAGRFYDWHPAPKPQFILYLAGQVAVVASGGEKHIFRAGEILLANDLSGKGHTSKTLTEGLAVIAPLKF